MNRIAAGTHSGLEAITGVVVLEVGSGTASGSDVTEELAPIEAVDGGGSVVDAVSGVHPAAKRHRATLNVSLRTSTILVGGRLGAGEPAIEERSHLLAGDDAAWAVGRSTETAECDS